MSADIDMEMSPAWLELLQALRDPTRHDHGKALQALDVAVAENKGNFGLIMMCVLCEASVAPELRQLAGLLVKNYGVAPLAACDADPSAQASFRNALLHALSDPLELVRRTAAIVLGQLSRSADGPVWLPVVPVLTQLLTQAASADSTRQADGALHAIQLICEDAGTLLAKDPARCLDALVPLLVELLARPGAHHRSPILGALLALVTLLEYAGEEPELSCGLQPLLLHLQRLLAHLGVAAGDADAAVRCGVCRILAQLASSNLEILAACLGDVCSFMQAALCDPAEAVAKEAAEFWLVLVTEEEAYRELQPRVPALVHACINRMRLSDEQLQEDREDAEETASGERKIRFLAARQRARGGGSGGQAADRGRGDWDGEEASKYTIRKSAALLLDRLSHPFSREVASTAVPLVQQLLSATGTSPCPPSPEQSAEVNVSLQKESGALAFGALAEGCWQDLAAALPVA